MASLFCYCGSAGNQIENKDLLYYLPAYKILYFYAKKQLPRDLDEIIVSAKSAALKRFKGVGSCWVIDAFVAYDTEILD